MILIKVTAFLLCLIATSLTAGATLVKSEEHKAQTNNLEDDKHPSSAGSSAVLETINSLDFSAGEHQSGSEELDMSIGKSQDLKIPQAAGGDHHQIKADTSIQQLHNNNTRPIVGRQRSSRTFKKANKRLPIAIANNNNNNNNNLTKTIASLLSQLERLDVRRMILDSINQIAPVDSSSNRKVKSPTDSSRLNLTHEANGKAFTGNKSRLSVSALGQETGNLMSVTKQIVKLARSQMLGPDMGNYMASGLAPSLIMPSMLSAASHLMHDSVSPDWAASSLAKSEWFWVVVPAVIVIGAGVIVVPLIAAWIVSHMMNQNTFTVSAGRRRRRRDVQGIGVDPLSFETTHRDLFKMLDIHQLLASDDPQLVVNKLARLHQILGSVGESLGMSKSSRSSKRSSDRAD